MKNKILVLGAVIVGVLGFSAFTSMDQKKDYSDYKAQNLQVLPEDISYEHLEGAMKAFNIALGVKCNHCHAPSKADPSKLDFASDDNPLKEVTRHMMRMTTEINEKYFKDFTKDGVVMQVGCNTCHNGQAQPEMRIMY